MAANGEDIPATLWTPITEGALILVIAAVGWAAHQPLVFTSLGPTAYELVEKPRRRSSRVYNILVGHLTGLGSGFAAVALLGAWTAPKVSLAGYVPLERMWASVIAVVLTAAITLLLKAGQPAALSTTLLVALGSMQTRQDALAMVGGFLMIAALGY